MQMMSLFEYLFT